MGSPGPSLGVKPSITQNTVSQGLLIIAEGRVRLSYKSRTFDEGG